MIAAISEDLSAATTATQEPAHWLGGRYFVPLPDLSDETRKAIYAGRSSSAWIEITTRLRYLERRGTDDQTRQAAVTGRIEGLGVNGLAAAIGCSHTTALKHLRHLESLGLIRTEQGEFTTEIDAATGRIRRNYAKAPPKVIVVTIEDRHCRPCRASGTRRGDTPGTSLKATGDTPETGRNAPSSQARNWRHSKERTSKEVRSFGTNRRRTAAGPLGRPAAAVAKTNPQQPPEPAWQRQAAEEERERTRQRAAEFMAEGLGLPVIEVIGLWKADSQGLKQRCVAAGIMTPEGNWIRNRTLCARNRMVTPVKAESPQADDAAVQRFTSVSERIWELREKAETSTEQHDIEQARKAAMKILRNYAKSEGLAAG